MKLTKTQIVKLLEDKALFFADNIRYYTPSYNEEEEVLEITYNIEEDFHRTISIPLNNLDVELLNNGRFYFKNLDKTFAILKPFSKQKVESLIKE